MLSFTAFCREATNEGTTFIGPVLIGPLTGETTEQTIQRARQEAIETCANAWSMEAKDVRCIGLIEGNVTMAFWEDVCDQEEFELIKIEES